MKKSGGIQFIGIILIVILIVFGVIITTRTSAKVIPEDFENFVNRCRYMDLINSMVCLNSQVKTFYIFNKTKDRTEVTFDDLKARGGDCKNWNELYGQASGELGFDYEYVVIPTRNNINHRFVIVYSSEGYCKLDLKDINCIKYNG